LGACSIKQTPFTGYPMPGKIRQNFRDRFVRENQWHQTLMTCISVQIPQKEVHDRRPL
jgi:hypothetical protein